MARYIRRAQVLFTEEQFSALEEHARRSHKPLGTMIREVVEEYVLSPGTRRRKRAAARRLLSQDLPAFDWKRFKEELAASHAGKKEAG